MTPRTTRRELLKVGLSGAAVVSMAHTMPAFVSQLAFAQQPKSAKLSNDNVLVVIQLTGGNDALNTVIPYADPAYARSRPKIGLHKNHLRLDDRFGLHPAMIGLKQLYDEGQLAVIHGCGYPDPNRSHFRSLEIWHTANPKSAQATGWLGHYIDHAARGGLAPVNALNIGSELPLALVNEGAPVPSIEKLEDFTLRTADAKLDRQLIKELNAVKDSGGSPALQFLSRQAANAILAADKLDEVAGKNQQGNVYFGPDPLGRQLQLISNLIAAGAGTRLFYAQTNGFDTHARQADEHQRLLGGVSQALFAFHQDLKAKGLNDKVMVMCFSEFGRRVAENSSAGTDHGAAAAMWVTGGKLKAGLHSKPPSLTDLDDGDLKYTTDFRRVYATLLERWLNADSAKVLGSKFEPVDFI
jgi:uncharacterized protein (DUF1501 family)